LDECLTAAAFGDLERLMVFMPPRHGKSETISRFLSAWYLGRFPDRRVMLTSYEANFAASWGRKARDLLLAYGPGPYGVVVAWGMRNAGCDEGEVLSRPALAEADDALERPPGQALCPGLGYGEAWMERTRAELGTYWFSALYQQAPRPLDGMLFKREDFRYF